MKTAKLIAKTFILSFVLLRLLQSLRHLIIYYLSQHKAFSLAFKLTALSFTEIICSLVLLLGTVGESVLFLEIWTVWIILKFLALILGGFDMNFEKDSFFPDSLETNFTISTCKKFCSKKIDIQ